MIADKTTTTSTPVISGGNSSLAMRGKTVSASASSGNSARPAMPANTAPVMKRKITVTDTVRAFLSSPSSRADM